MSAQQITYRLKLLDPAAHIFEIQCTVTEPDPAGQKFFLPAWIPGSYMIRDFARHVVSLCAETTTGPVAVHKLDKQTWQCAPVEHSLAVTYQVYAWDLSVRGAHLDTTHAFFNGTSVFLMPLGCEAWPCEVELLAPTDKSLGDWRVATAMQRATATPAGSFGMYTAVNYDELIDHPVEMGTFHSSEFEVAGVRHEMAITGRHHADMGRLCKDVEKICAVHIKLFEELPDIDQYLFLVTAVGNGYGGLEHRASCSLLCSRGDLPHPGDDAIGSDYRKFLGLCSHEYFHTWNIKRIKPEVFTPYELADENYTRQLWAFEGITSYYDDLGLLRAGLIKLDDYLEMLSETATRVWRGQGRHKQSIAESSFDAWTKFYKQDENAANAIVSYYTKGALLALSLDLRIRKHTGNKKSLDTLMQILWQQFGKTGVGVPEGKIEQLASEIADTDFSDFFARHLYGTTDIPLENDLQYIGVQLCKRAACGGDDKGGALPRGQTPLMSSIGAVYADKANGVALSSVTQGGAVQVAGMSAGDLIVAVNDIKANKSQLEQIQRKTAPGDHLRIHAFRRDEMMEFVVTLQAPEESTIFFEALTDVDTTTLTARADWLWKNNS